MKRNKIIIYLMVLVSCITGCAQQTETEETTTIAENNTQDAQIEEPEAYNPIENTKIEDNNHNSSNENQEESKNEEIAEEKTIIVPEDVEYISGSIRKLVIQPDTVIITEGSTGECKRIEDEKIAKTVLTYLEDLPVCLSEERMTKEETESVTTYEYQIEFMREDKSISKYIYKEEYIIMYSEVYFYEEDEELKNYLEELMTQK